MTHITKDIQYMPYHTPEIWAGLECTINRVKDDYKDQLDYSGHYTRPDDVDKFVQLGIKAIRYPVLWEHHQQNSQEEIQWSWTDRQLEKMKNNKIKIIAGLLHHGSGPSFTNLYDKSFPREFACYASKVANRFPWIEYYTPVNEPLTTARFSGLYGFWYPHHINDHSFLTMLINQLKGVVLAMQQIRKFNPGAKLVQTEDLSKIHSTAGLSYQAKFENERRWLTNDILCGMLDKKHPLWKYFLSSGITESDLSFFLEHPCPPDILGFNYYVTSERYLDDQLQNYPLDLHGGNGRHRYVDTEAVRKITIDGVGKLLSEAWDRYKLPLAITEAHLNCSREEQLRWLKEIWDECCILKTKGIDLKAVTAWSLLGAFDWNSLLVQDNRHYESGVFLLRKNKVNHTALSNMVCSLAKTGNYDHPVLAGKGWWLANNKNGNFLSGKKIPPILIIGKTGTLGTAFGKICNMRSIHHVCPGRDELDIANENSFCKAMDKYKPWGIINASGYVKVDEAENNMATCFEINTSGPENLARICNKLGIKLMTFSSDFVFDGNKKFPYMEDDLISPLNVYGESKAIGESLVQAANPDSLIIRTSSFFGPWDKYNFAYHVITSLQQHLPCCVVRDVVMSPTYIPDLVSISLDLFIDDETGIWHICNDGTISWSGFAVAIAERAGFSKNRLKEKSLPEMRWKAKRPLYSALENSRGIKLPSIDNALTRFFEQKIYS